MAEVKITPADGVAVRFTSPVTACNVAHWWKKKPTATIWIVKTDERVTLWFQELKYGETSPLILSTSGLVFEMRLPEQYRPQKVVQCAVQFHGFHHDGHYGSSTHIRPPTRSERLQINPDGTIKTATTDEITRGGVFWSDIAGFGDTECAYNTAADREDVSPSTVDRLSIIERDIAEIKSRLGV